MEKLKSRKFWFTVVGAVASAVSPFYGVEPELAVKLVVGILAIFIGAEGAVDAVRANNSTEN